MPARRKPLIGTWVPDHKRKRVITVTAEHYSESGKDWEKGRVTYVADFATGRRKKSCKRIAMLRWIRKHNAVLTQPLSGRASLPDFDGSHRAW